MGTKKTVTTTTKTTTGPRKGGPVNPQSLLMQQMAAHWNALSGVEKNEWERLTQQINSPAYPAAPVRTTGFATFVALNSGLLNSGRAMLTAAPPQPDTPAPLPPVTLDVLSQAGGLAIVLTPTGSSTQPILLYGAAPMLANRRVYDNTAFRLLGTLPGLAGQTDVTDLYAALFRMPSAGFQVALKLVGVTTHGFRSPATLATSTAPLAMAAGADLHLKAA